MQLSAMLLSADVRALHRVGAQTVPCCSGATRRLTHTAGLTAKAGSYRGTQPYPLRTRSLSASTVSVHWCTAAQRRPGPRERLSGTCAVLAFAAVACVQSMRQSHSHRRVEPELMGS